MNNWIECDDMVYNEDEKRAVVWTVYGDNTKYFLSQEYFYNEDPFEEIDQDKSILVNREITEDETLEFLITKTKEML